MSSEVCPFCGKTYKRLKSHLPHCKAAASSKTPPTKRDVEANQPSPHPLAAAASKAAAKGKKSIQTETMRAQTEKDEKASASSSSSPVNSSSLPPSTKNKKHKLSDQIKAASLFSPASLPAIVSKPKKQSLRALIEAAKSKRGTLEGEDLPSDSTLSSRTKTKADKDSVKDAASPSLLSADPKDAPKKMSKPKKASQSSSTSTSDFLDSGLNKSSLRLHARDFWVDSEEEIEDLSVNTLKSKVTLQDVKSRLGRGSGPRRSGSIQAEAAVSCVLTPSDRPLRSTSQQTELKPVKKEASQSEQPAVVSLADSGPPQPEPAGPPQPEPAGPPQPEPAGPAQTPAEGLEVRRHGAGLLSAPPALCWVSSPRFPRAQTVPVKVDGVEKLQLEVRKQNAAQNPPEGVLTRPSLGQVTLRDLPEWPSLGQVTLRDLPERPSLGQVTLRDLPERPSLGQVTLRDLPEWMACRTPSHPREVLEMVQRGWQWYYRRYIDVKKGGVAGLGMLLAGYCVISYMWSYPNTKLDRWRKYH